MLRHAVVTDVPELIRLVRGLAEYEREPDAVEATQELYVASLFLRHGAPAAYAEVAEVDGRLVGLAVWFTTFSTWTGRPGIWVEDLFVAPEHRGAGTGTALLRRLATICLERDYRRLEWSVLTWNAPAVGFYLSLGARPMDGWQQYRVDGPALRALGGG